MKTAPLGSLFDRIYRRLFGEVYGPLLFEREKEMAFKFANKTVTKRYESEDGEDWIVVRGEITKKEHADLTRDMSPNMGDGSRTVGEFYVLNDKFFDLIMLDWSLQRENPETGQVEKVPVSLQAYYDLDTQSSNVIDGWLGDHMREHFGRDVEELEGEATS